VSPNVDDKVVWDPRYSSNAIDTELLARGAQFVETLVKTEPFKGLFKQRSDTVTPARLPVGGDTSTLEGAREVVKKGHLSIFHIAGSCAMRPRELGGVVDERLRVHGVRGLRVVDASVFPLQQSGNISNTVYAVAERAADLIKEDYQ
jgi:choline dehydrogenase-like flavoprotein